MLSKCSATACLGEARVCCVCSAADLLQTDVCGDSSSMPVYAAVPAEQLFFVPSLF